MQEVPTNKVNLIPNKPNTTLMKNFYTYIEINLFNKFPQNIKVIENNSRFKIVINQIYMQLFCKRVLLLCLIISY